MANARGILGINAVNQTCIQRIHVCLNVLTIGCTIYMERLRSEGDVEIDMFFDLSDKQSLTTKVYNHIRNGILDGSYKDGDFLVETRLAEELEVSRTPIREALKQLELEGKIKLTTAWSHKKVACMITPGGYYVVEGSGNYGENSLHEQYVFLNSKKVCLFRMSDS